LPERCSTTRGGAQTARDHDQDIEDRERSEVTERPLSRAKPRHIGEILRDLGWLPKGEDEPYVGDDEAA
jgi:hypothetical protein